MKIECDENPDDLIGEIGDSCFSICDENYGDGLWKHNDHPRTLRIIDCEDGVSIDVWSEHGVEDTRKMAEALLRLLNQDYKLI